MRPIRNSDKIGIIITKIPTFANNIMYSESANNHVTNPVYTLGVASKLSGISVYSIRQYIDKGLLIPYRTNTNRHLFSEVDILRLKCITQYLQEQGLNIAGIKSLYSMTPCWNIKSCSTEERNNCDAYNSITVPCWEASKKGSCNTNSDCRICIVYQIPEKYNGLKPLLQEKLK